MPLGKKKRFLFRKRFNDGYDHQRESRYIFTSLDLHKKYQSLWCHTHLLPSIVFKGISAFSITGAPQLAKSGDLL